VIVTGDVFLADVARRAELRSALGATAIEMEGAAVVQAATSYEQFLGTASENAATLVTAMIGRLGPSR
jgi:nucleoside phosphorylase